MQAKSGFNGLTVLEKIDKATFVHKCLSERPDVFVNVKPTLEVFKGKIDGLSVAHNDAAKGGTDKNLVVKMRVKELDITMSLITSYVTVISEGNLQIILLAGLEGTAERVKAPVPGQPENVKALTSAYPGRIVLKFKKVPTAKHYTAEKSTDGISDWVYCGTSTNTTITVEDLPSVTNVWFRVTANNAAGGGPASIAVKGLVS